MPTFCRHRDDIMGTLRRPRRYDDDEDDNDTRRIVVARLPHVVRIAWGTNASGIYHLAGSRTAGGAASAYVTPSAPFADAHPHLTARRAVTRLGTLEEYHTARFRAARSTIYDVGVAHATGH
jgi:hypothetical protein